MSKKRRLISVISLHICDIVSTIIIFAIIFQIALQSVPQILLGAGLGYYYERDAAYNFYFGEAPEATLALFITTFFTSVWALMYALSLLTLRVIGHLKKHWICPYGYCRFRLTQFEP